MKYIPKAKGLKLGLFTEFGGAARLPKGVKVRFDMVSGTPAFQFFDGEKAISPILVQLEDESGFKFTGTLKSGLVVDLDLEKQTVSEPYAGKLENVKIGENGEVLIMDEAGKTQKQPYVLDHKRLKMGFENGYLLQSLVGVKGKNGKCAIFDAYTQKLVTDFVLDASNYGIVGALNLDTASALDMYYIVKTTADDSVDKSARKYIIVSDNGKPVTQLNAAGYLWNFKHKEKAPNGKETEYSYAAFVQKTDNNSYQTKILKINIETGKLEQETSVPFVADRASQAGGKFIFTPDNRLVLITRHPEVKASKGAYVLNADGSVEKLLENNNIEIGYSHHYQKGDCLIFKNQETVGKVALSAKARTFEVSRTGFSSLAKKYFGTSNASEVASTIQAATPAKKMPAATSKHKPTGESGPGGMGE